MHHSVIRPLSDTGNTMRIPILMCRTLLSIFAVAVLSACTLPYRQPVMETRTGRVEFMGVSSLLKDAARADILLVHGMCTHDESWARSSLETLAKELGAQPPEITQIRVPESQAVVFVANFAARAGSVHASAILWSPITASLKSQLCYDETDKSPLCVHSRPYPYTRATLNRQMKDTLLNDCLSDALIYQGESRELISQQMQKAILVAESSAQSGNNDRVPLAVVTDSLGSKIAFDALYKMTISSDETQRSAGIATLERTTLVFMRANQLPILGLADQVIATPGMRAPSQTRYPADPLGAALSRTRSRANAQPRQVVAFTDPNDLLSYILTPSGLGNGYEIIDVVVSNQPTLLGVVERPDTAHTTYAANPAVLRLIACGYPNKNCP